MLMTWIVSTMIPSLLRGLARAVYVHKTHKSCMRARRSLVDAHLIAPRRQPASVREVDLFSMMQIVVFARGFKI